MVGVGSHISHCTMALRDPKDGQLYIVESQGDSYVPTKGIGRSLFKDWIKDADRVDYHVIHLPLNAENRAKFNATAAWEFWNKTEGLPYGFHNFLYGWIDTPSDNWPPVLPDKLVPIVFEIVEKFKP